MTGIAWLRICTRNARRIHYLRQKNETKIEAHIMVNRIDDYAKDGGEELFIAMHSLADVVQQRHIVLA